MHYLVPIGVGLAVVTIFVALYYHFVVKRKEHFDLKAGLPQRHSYEWMNLHAKDIPVITVDPEKNGITRPRWGPLYTNDGTTPNLHHSYKQMSRLPWCNEPLARLPQNNEKRQQFPYKADGPGVAYENNKW